MLQLKELENWFDDTEVLISEISEISMNMDRILHPLNGKEEKLLKNAFFDHYLAMLRTVLVIQLSKLFIHNDKERRNFRKLFNRLRYEPYDKKLKSRLKENRGKAGSFVYKRDIIELIDSLLQKLDMKSAIIHSMKVLRDRHFAHTDPGKELPDLSSMHLLELSQLAEDIYTALSTALFGRNTVFTKNKNRSIDPIIRAN